MRGVADLVPVPSGARYIPPELIFSEYDVIRFSHPVLVVCNCSFEIHFPDFIACPPFSSG